MIIWRTIAFLAVRCAQVCHLDRAHICSTACTCIRLQPRQSYPYMNDLIEISTKLHCYLKSSMARPTVAEVNRSGMALASNFFTLDVRV